LIGERREDLNLLIGKGTDRRARKTNDPDWPSLASQRNGEHSPISAAFLGFADRKVGARGNAREVNDAPSEQSTASDRAPVSRNRPGSNIVHEGRWKIDARDPVIVSTLGPDDPGHVRLAKFRGRLSKRVEHNLKIKSRPADDLQHVCRNCLLLE